MWTILRGIHYVDSIAQYLLRTLLRSICGHYCAVSVDTIAQCPLYVGSIALYPLNNVDNIAWYPLCR